MSHLDPDRVFGSAFDNAPIGMAVLDPGGVIRLCNPAVGELLGRPSGELVGDTFFSVTHPDDLPAARHNCGLITHGKVRIVRHECRFLRPDGSVVWVSVSTSGVAAANGHPAHCVMHIEDIDDRKSLEAELRHRALHDPLTGLGNRALLLERIRQAADAPSRGGRAARQRHCLFYLDLDGFKSVNDRYGHRAGDHVLCQLADRIRSVLVDGDTAARIGGDEFVVLRAGDGGADTDDTVAAELARTVARPYVVDGREIALTAAIGLGRSRPGVDPADELDDLLEQADRHMYLAKERARRNRPATTGRYG